MREYSTEEEEKYNNSAKKEQDGASNASETSARALAFCSDQPA
jgi:hypothetical protein